MQRVPARPNTGDVDPLAIERPVVHILPTGGQTLIVAVIASALGRIIEVFVIVPQTESLFGPTEDELAARIVNLVRNQVTEVVVVRWW